MLPEIVQFDRQVTLVGDSGIHFMDFGLKLGRIPAGEFVELASGILTRLLYNEAKDFYFFQPKPDAIEKAKSKYDIPMDLSLKLLDGQWLPLPVFRFSPPHFYQEGPLNWSRFRLVKLPEPDMDGYTHRLTLAFDTRIMNKSQGTVDLGPNQEDVSAGATFQIATSTYALNWYLSQPWLKEWLLETYNDGSKGRDRDERDEEIAKQYPVAHYLNLLSLLAMPVEDQQTQTPPHVVIPQFRIIANGETNAIKPISVDLVLDVGNSRTCGILIEDHGQYPRKMCFDVFGADKIEQFNIQMGEELTVSFDVDARQWQDRWFNSIRAWKVERVGAGAPMAPGAPVPPPAPSSAPEFIAGDAKDDLPF